MKPNPITIEVPLSEGRVVTIETGKLAKQADGSVVVRCGDTMLLATVVSAKEAKDGVDFMPLTVDYRENYAAAGRFPGGFLKREARPSEYEILISRLIDRAMRPMFPDDYHADTQVLVTLISLDKEILPDALAGLSAAAAIAVSDIPFNGPISEVRVGRIDGKFVINPTRTELERSDIDMIVAGSIKDVVMVEGEMKEVKEEDMLEAIRVAHQVIQEQCKKLNELTTLVGKETKRAYSHEVNDQDLKDRMFRELYDKVSAVAHMPSAKEVRGDAFKLIKEEFKATFSEEELAEKSGMIDRYYKDVEKHAMREMILTDRQRLDGRRMDEVRPIWAEVDYLPSAHGSAVFTRGETQSLTTVTLGAKMDEQLIDGVVHEGTSKFLLHYNFPPFSTGEAKPMRGLGRREVGHGNLAMRAIKWSLPEENAYTIRVVSDILESNGSSSMATVCAGSLALMDAGVQVKKPVAGIAMGLVSEANMVRYGILSDILGDEDHLGDMDFKVAGTVDGITATQMDIKVDGLSFGVVKEALEQARAGRLHILNEMSKAIQGPRPDLKPHAPRITTIQIPRDYIGAVIGPGGKIIQEMQRESGAEISIEEIGDFGHVVISSPNLESIEKALNRIRAIVAIPEVGEVYEATVKSIMPYGAFVEFLPGKEGLLHISEVDWKRLESLEGILNKGDKLQVKLLEVDQKTGKFKLSRKVLLERPPRPQANNEQH
ncbi:MAG TPA: polyribonucleotide nucleotidyltransferase [Chitinophagales bacterium]|nr:polyribonucleotide nucleotidyltransferase [Chitinophagales bacterium]HMZ89944.1 polyribonucleotide nucleotidyltransferase [Chitinophagales bacterium]HNE46468.1 polyribonucleotide nucleotidyltransferase [Chitinophagales bacterium]HNF69819.1 polyribonucleotide nucleotidyltransferase [Chitinophagales bacterium]HNI54146.1 polyribonucleotide nucleotidyltransferase [Chitinophagales bacterium]